MQTITLDVALAPTGVTRHFFPAPTDLGTAELVLWQPEALMASYAHAVESFGESPTLTVAGSYKLLSDARHWRDEFAGLIERGGTLAVLAPSSPGFGIHTLQEIVPFDLLEALPGPRIARTSRDGNEGIVCHAGEPFHSFFDAVGHLFGGRVNYASANDRIVARSAETNGAAAIYSYRHPGHLILLPSIREDASGSDVSRLIASLGNLARRLQHPGRVSALHAWAAALQLPGEAELRSRADSVRRDLARLRQEEAQIREAIADHEFLKQLVAGDRAGVLKAAAFVLLALDAYPQAGTGDDSSIVFDRADELGVLIVVSDAPERLVPQRILDDAHRRAAHLESELGQRPHIALLYCGGNDRGLDDTREGARILRNAMPAHIAVVTGEQMLAAYQQRDRSFVSSLLPR